jgi:hypothetical protein
MGTEQRGRPVAAPAPSVEVGCWSRCQTLLMANVRVTHHNGSVDTFENASFEIGRGGVLKVREAGEPSRYFAPTGWASVTKSKRTKE